jgi:hypothetical protein
VSGDLAAYLVDLERLRSVLGGGDTALEQDIVAGCFTTVRFYFVGWAGGRIGDGGPTLTDAVTALVHGGPFDDRFAYQYAYALEPICAAVGEELDNSLWCEVGDVVFEEVDDFFHRAGAFVRTDELCFERRLPIALPGAPGEPDIGFRGRGEIADIAITLEKACTEAEGSDEWFVENARAVRDWFARAAEAGLDLVFFGS